MKRMIMVVVVIGMLGIGSRAQGGLVSSIDQNAQLELGYSGKKLFVGGNIQFGEVSSGYNFLALGPTIGYRYLPKDPKKLSLYIIGRGYYIDFKGKIKGNGFGGFMGIGGEYKLLFLEAGEEFLFLKDRETGLSASGREPGFRIGLRAYF